MKQTYKKRTGYDHPSQNPSIHEKQNNYKNKKHIMPSGEIRNIQGYEHFSLNILVEKYEETDILTHKGVPIINYVFEEKERKYYPDIYIKSENLNIEVKSTWTYKKYLDKNLAKQQACLDQGYNFMFMIFDNKGNLIN